jgi:glucan phosphoethanolaminetransferase (alkaline phosphatase superfamily)
VFLICIVLIFYFYLFILFYFIFSYITIVVNLYDTNHEKNNQLYNFFLLLIFVFTAYTNIVFIIKIVL